MSGKFLIDIFIGKFSEELTSRDKALFEGFRKNIFSFFEMLEVEVGRIKMQDLSTDKIYDVSEHQASLQLKARDILVARLLPWDKQWVISGPCLSFQGERAYLMKRDFLRRQAAENVEKINAITLNQILSNTAQTKQARPPKPLKLSQVRKQMARALERYMANDPIALADLEAWITNDRPDEEIRQAIIQRTCFENTKEIKRFFEVYQDFANALPRKSKAGFSPQEIVTIAPPGPKEKAVTEDLMRSVMSDVNPEDYSDVELRQKAVELFQEKWLHEPQKELGGKSPYQAILAERKTLGNPRTDFSLRINVSAVPVATYSLKAFSALHEKEVPLLGDLRRLLVLCGGDTAIKNTREKKRVFQQMENDGNFAKLEYKQDAEEYFDFLLAIAKPAQQLFKTASSTGEILCGLGGVWCAELKWEKFQKDVLLKEYAEHFQRNLKMTLNHFGEFAEKKRSLSPRDLAYKMFASKKEMLDRDAETCQTISEAMRSVLMRYFLWLGILTKKGLMDHSTYYVSESGWALFVKLLDALFPRRR